MHAVENRFLHELVKSDRPLNPIQSVLIIQRKSVHTRGSLSIGLETWTADKQVVRSILHWGMFHTKIHLISPGCPQPSIVLSLECRVEAKNTIHSFTTSIQLHYR